MYDDAMSVAKANKEKEEMDMYWDRRIKYERTSGDLTLDFADRADICTLLSLIEIDANGLKDEMPGNFGVRLLQEHVNRLRKAWDEAEQRHKDYLRRGWEQM